MAEWPGDALSAALRRHGLSRRAATEARRLGEELRHATVATGDEFGGALDAATGVRVGDAVRGTPEGVHLGPIYARMVPGRRYAVAHTHPANSSFSPEDGVILVVRAVETKVMLLVGGDGTWYALSRTPAALLPEPARLVAVWEEAADRLDGEFEALVAAGAVTPEAAWRQQSHRIWLGIAPGLGLRYDRVEP